MADPLDILSLGDAYEAINNPASTGHDYQLARWITGVSRRVDDLCGPVVVRTITKELHDGGRGDVWPRRRPVSSVTSVVEYDNTTATTLTAETNTSKPDDGYMLDDRGGRYQIIVRRSGNADVTFQPGRRNVEVTYKAGRYADTASVDEKFKMAVGAILRRLWSRESSMWASGGDPFTELGAGTSRFYRTVDPMVAEFLADEKRVPAVG